MDYCGRNSVAAGGGTMSATARDTTMDCCRRNSVTAGGGTMSAPAGGLLQGELSDCWRRHYVGSCWGTAMGYCRRNSVTAGGGTMSVTAGGLQWATAGGTQ